MEPFKLILLFLGGICAGLYASRVGGGSLVTLPALILAGLPSPIALGTNRLSAVILEFASALKFHREKKFRIKAAIQLALIAGMGAVIGSLIVVRIDAEILNLIIAVVLISLSVVVLKRGSLGLTEEPEKIHRTRARLFGGMFLLGIYWGFIGAGAGAFVAMLLVMCGYAFFEAAAIGRVIGIVGSGVALAVFAYNDLVRYPYGIALGLGTAVGSWIGIGIAVKKGNTYIRSLFLVLIVATVIKLIVDVIH